MSKTPLKIEELRDLIHKGEAKDPLVFLESVMNGQDPRAFSGIYTLILEIDSFTNGELEKEDWNELVDYAITHSKFKNVTLNESTNAAKTIAEYLHAKRKQVEKIDGALAGSGVAESLTEEDIELFKEKFNDEF